MAYSTSRNYAKEIEDAIASGASADYVAQLQQERNEKIAANQAHYDSIGVGGSDSYGQAATNYVNGAGGGSLNNQYAGTNYHQDAIDAAIAGNWDAVTQFLGQREQKVADQGGNNRGKTSAEIYAELWNLYGNQQPDYSSDWLGTRDSLAQQYLGMNYTDWLQGDEYKALMERYGQSGRLAMQDTLGQISGRTGGLASSYATTAAQQQYNDYMAALEQAAREMYGAERDDLYSNVQLAGSLEQRDYDRYIDSLNQYWTQKEFDTNQDRYDQSQLQQRAETMAAYGDFSGYKALGYSDEQIALMKAAYDSALAAENAQGNKTGGGGGGYDNGGLTTEQIKELQEYYGVTADGKWGKNSKEAAGGLTAEEAWAEYGGSGAELNWSSVNDLGLGPVSATYVAEIAAAGGIVEDDKGNVSWAPGWNAENYKTKMALKNPIYGFSNWSGNF